MDVQNHKPQPTFIPDGYTRKGFIKAIPGLHGEVRFSYRPMLPGQRDSTRNAINRERGEKASTLQAAAIAGHLTSWDCVYPEDGPDENLRGKIVPISVENVRHLIPSLFDRLFVIIGGMDASDPEPEAAPAEQKEYADLLLQAAESGGAPGDVALAVQQKN